MAAVKEINYYLNPLEIPLLMSFMSNNNTLMPENIGEERRQRIFKILVKVLNEIEYNGNTEMIIKRLKKLLKEGVHGSWIKNMMIEFSNVLVNTKEMKIDHYKRKIEFHLKLLRDTEHKRNQSQNALRYLIIARENMKIGFNSDRSFDESYAAVAPSTPPVHGHGSALIISPTVASE